LIILLSEAFWLGGSFLRAANISVKRHFLSI
jgi:hypothetical protein